MKNWYDEINDSDKAKVLSFTIGMLFSKVNLKSETDEKEKAYADWLLQQMTKYVKENDMVTEERE